MSKITKKQFLADVMHEIEMLKKHATPEELSNLDFEYFDPEYPTQCIYGQMAGDCTNSRAKELMDISCIRQMSLKDGVKDLFDKPFDAVSALVNGPYNGDTWHGGTWADRRWIYLSALEGYINLKGAKNKEIIAYLKGEQSTLTL